MATTNPELPNFDDLWDYDRPQETEARFRELLPAAEMSGDRSYHVELLTQIARAQGLQRKFEQAHRTLDRVEGLLSEDLVRARVRYLLERGRVFNSAREPERARPLFLQAFELASDRGEDFYAVDAAHMMAIVEPPERQLDWNLRALSLAERSADDRARRWLGSLYNNIGWTYHGAGRYEEALQTFERALACREAQGQAKETGIARWCVARTLRSLGRYEEALEIQKALLREHERSGEADGYVYEELAECLLALGHASSARAYFALAYAELSKDPWLVESDPARIQRLERNS
jgi:tetratricopeptide (TPR) repeat protein